MPTETGRMALQKEIANSRNKRQAEQPCEELLRCFTLKILKISAAFGGGEEQLTIPNFRIFR
jgi:hypothetical protein